MIDVRRSATWIVQHAQSVSIIEEHVSSVAEKITQQKFATPIELTEPPFIGQSQSEAIVWCFVLDAVNFCFWATPEQKKWYAQDVDGQWKDGYWGLVAALRKEVYRNRNFLNPAHLCSISLTDVRRIFLGQGKIPLLEKRHQAIAEVGVFLSAGVEVFTSNVQQFVDLVITKLPLFRDEAIYRGRKIGFYKRAQLLAQDLTLTLHHYKVVPFVNLGTLTAFADYKIPQLLRQEGVLVYGPTLSARVDAYQELTAGSDEEIEIRGSMIRAVELIREAILRKGQEFTSAFLDNILWTEAISRQDSMKPYHRTRTTNY